MAEQPAKSQTDVEKEQEAMLMAKYGGLKPKKKLLPKDHKFFDSADWAMAKEGQKKPGDAPAAAPAEQAPAPEHLPPKLEPTPVPARRISHLDPMESLKAT